MYEFVKRADMEIRFVALRKNVMKTYQNDFRKTNSLVYYTAGGHTFFFEDKKVVGRVGDIVVLPYGACYKNEVISDDTEYYQIDFCIYNKGKPQAVVAEPTVIKKVLGENAQYLFGGICKNYAENQNGSMLLCIADTLKILAMIQNHPDTVKNKDKTQEILLYIKSNCFEDISSAQIAKRFNISVSQLEKKIKSNLGISPTQLKNATRIEKAKQLLAEGCPIKEVAYETGFSDRYYFTKVFTRFAKQSPTQFIKSLGI